MSHPLSTKRFIRKEKIAWRYIAPEAILVHSGQRTTYPLNAVGAHLWRLLDGRRNVQEIIEEVQRHFDAVPETAEEELLQFFEELLSKDLIEAFVQKEEMPHELLH